MDAVRLTKTGNVFLLTIDDGKDNRLTLKTLQQMVNCLDLVEKSLPDLENGAALVTTGAGNYYSNGIEIKKWDPQDLIEFSKLLYSLLSRLLVFPIPTICAINGHAAGAGAMLAFAHDYRVMNADRGWIYYPLIHIGLVLPDPLIELLKTKVQKPHVIRDLVLRAKKSDALYCLNENIVDFIEPEDSIVEAAMRFGAVVSACGKDQQTYGGLKRRLYEGVYLKLTEPKEDGLLTFSKPVLKSKL